MDYKNKTNKKSAPEGAQAISIPVIKISVSFNAVNDKQPSLFPDEEQQTKTQVAPHVSTEELVHLSAIERQVYAYLEQPKMSEESLMDKMHTRNWKQINNTLHRLKAKGAINFFIEDKVIYSKRFSRASCREPNSVDLFDLPLSATTMYH